MKISLFDDWDNTYNKLIGNKIAQQQQKEEEAFFYLVVLLDDKLAIYSFFLHSLGLNGVVKFSSIIVIEQFEYRWVVEWQKKRV